MQDLACKFDWGLFSDVLIGLSAVVAAYSAIAGLYTWKSQIKRSEKHDLAKETLRTTFRLKNLIKKYYYSLTLTHIKVWGSSSHARAIEASEKDDESAARTIDMLTEISEIFSNIEELSFDFSAIGLKNFSLELKELKSIDDELSELGLLQSELIWDSGTPEKFEQYQSLAEGIIPLKSLSELQQLTLRRTFHKNLDSATDKLANSLR